MPSEAAGMIRAPLYRLWNVDRDCLASGSGVLSCLVPMTVGDVAGAGGRCRRWDLVAARGLTESLKTWAPSQLCCGLLQLWTLLAGGLLRRWNLLAGGLRRRWHLLAGGLRRRWNLLACSPASGLPGLLWRKSDALVLCCPCRVHDLGAGD